MASNSEQIEVRLQVLEDRKAIKQLRHEFSRYVDGRDWEALLALFTDDAKIEFPEDDRDSIQGTEELREWCSDIEAGYEFTAHMYNNPVINAGGDRAEGFWYFETPMVPTDGAGMWAQGTYDETYIRREDGWKIETTAIRYNYLVEYQEAWEKAVTEE